MVFLFYGIISFVIIVIVVKYLANINSTKLQSLIKIILGGILHIVSLILLFRGLYYFSGPLLVFSLWLTRLKTFYDFYNSFFKKNNNKISMDKNEAKIFNTTMNMPAISNTWYFYDLHKKLVLIDKEITLKPIKVINNYY